MVATVTLNPALDKLIYVDSLLPNDTNRITKIEIDAGGKGVNASRVLHELGTETIALGFVGGQTGRFIEQVLDSEGIPSDFVHIAGETRTNIAIQEASGAPPTTLNEPGPAVTDEEFEQLYGKVCQYARASSMVLFGGSLPPRAPTDLYRRLVAAVKQEGARAILDSDGEPMRLGMESRPFMIKPNRDEVKRLIGMEIRSLDDAVRALHVLCGRGVELVVISMGADGAVAGCLGEVWHAVPPQVKTVSTIGSGDSMIAGIAHILTGGGTLDEALRWGTAAGAATAMTDGTEIGRREQVLDLLDQVCIQKIA